MPFKKHSVFLSPSRSNQKTWRYMSFTKFISLISTENLYFCNQEVLAKTDPFEGALAEPNYAHRRWKSLSDLSPEEKAEIGITEYTDDSVKIILIENTVRKREHSIKRSFCNRKALYINCWHMDDYDAAAMWPIYAPGNEGIAITSTYEKMKESISLSEEQIYIGTVSYKDYKLDRIDDDNGFRSCVHKRESFSFEKEIRMIVWDQHVTHIVENGYLVGLREEKDIESMKVPSGKNIKCNLDVLIEEVYVSPTSADWFYDLVQSACNKYGIRKEIKRSDLASTPPR